MSTILVVDDDQLAAESFTAFLRHLGYRVSFATSGSAALETLRGDLPDLVILDVMMPDLNGVELLRRIRADVRTATVPVVIYRRWTMISGRRRREMRARAITGSRAGSALENLRRRSDRNCTHEQ